MSLTLGNSLTPAVDTADKHIVWNISVWAPYASFVKIWNGPIGILRRVTVSRQNLKSNSLVRFPLTDRQARQAKSLLLLYRYSLLYWQYITYMCSIYKRSYMLMGTCLVFTLTFENNNFLCCYRELHIEDTCKKFIPAVNLPLYVIFISAFIYWIYRL